MKWFKHDSNANTDAKLKRVRMKHGMEGYGLYWYCLELIASGVEKHNITFRLEHDAEIIAHDTGIHYERIEEIMRDFVELKLFENVEGIITCMKMASRTDDYIGRITTKKLRTNYEQTTKKVVVNRIEEKRRDKKRKEKDNVVFPEWLNKPLWFDYCENRKAMKSKMTPRAEKMLLNELKKLIDDGNCQDSVIRASIMNNWKGLFPVDKKTVKQRKSSEELMREEYLAKKQMDKEMKNERAKYASS